MSRKSKLAILLLLAVCILLPALMIAQSAELRSLEPAGKLLAADGSDNHHFGRSLAIDGQTAVVGAPSWNNAGIDRQGAAYIFTRDSAGWSERTRLMDDEGGMGDGFGVAVALDGNTLAVGAFNKNRPSPNFATDVGAVFVYTGAGSAWTKQVTLRPDDLVEMNFFGSSVDLDGETLIAGAPTFFSTQNQSAYVYVRAGATWAQSGKLTPPDQTIDRAFGRAVAVAGDVALVGAPHGTQLPTPPGEVYVFIRNGTTWSPAGTITPDDGEDGDNFGCDIDFDGQTAVIAACEAYGVTPGPGKAYVFARSGNSWVQQAKLTADVDGLPLDVDSVALYGDRIVLGSSDAPKELGEWTGATFVYERQGATWAYSETLYATDAQTQDGFGQAAALSADTLLAGAPTKNVSNNSEQGAVYAFTRTVVEPAYRLHLPLVVKPSAGPALGNRIVYIDKAGSEYDIFVINADGTGKTNLSQSPEGEYTPRWSPDRQQILYVRADSTGVNLWVMNSDGSGQKHIPTPGLDMVSWPDWSPDGRKIALAASSGTLGWDIYTITVDGSGLTNLTADVMGEATDPSWSPDGTRIVFRHSPANMDLVVMNADGSGKKNLTDDAFSENYPHWSPDGGSILFFGGPGGPTPSIYALPAAGGQRQLLIENAMYGRWSADGQSVVFTGGGGGIFRADADGTNVAPVDESPEASLADW